ncbi:MAG: AraC family transcriptional regulator [Chryseobacterium sp.]|jgi:AraC-like DNA-binding protein|uniref:helix-turn-helix domain-containing protein n=1 Tax=Chryseobacterium sp. TaxID=1871047 RepID=UPI002830B0CF|nr:AraC family transcriptional regulator [Chryseobacterium sp.]MDR2234981.1 AraC family transcriptional regulator [Chryseobacterium sp.]
MNNEFYCRFLVPDPSLDCFVENIGMFHNPSGEAKEVVIIPDGRIDLFFLTSGHTFQVLLMGLETAPKERNIPPHTYALVVSFRPLGSEYILHTSIADLLNTAKELPPDFWNFNAEDLSDFEKFYERASEKIKEHIPPTIDERKQMLFDLLYSSKGEMSVTELSEKTSWNSRQINRYFSKQFGVSLKSYATILRFRASLEHIAEGKLFPELNFTDQTHFIKEIKKFSGVVPKELSKNKNDRFVLLSVLKQT